MTKPISTDEYRKRRERVLRSLKGAVGLVYSGDATHGRGERWRSNDDFLYLTGMEEESGAALLFDPTAPDPTRRCILFLRPRDPDMETWEGRRDPLGDELRARTGFDRVMRTWAMPRSLGLGAQRAKRLACLHPFATHTQSVSPDLETFNKVVQRRIGVSIEDRTELLSSMRGVKSPAERAIIKRAIEITHSGLDAAIAAMKPGGNEADVQAAIDHAYRAGGAPRSAFDTIVGSGGNATVLHYISNDQPLGKNDLVLIDTGSEYHGYASDITRCFPVSGKFTDRQREVYNVVLKAQRAAIRAVAPGQTLAKAEGAARAVLEKAGLGGSMVHGIGHHMGLDVHDVEPGGPLKPGAIVTIEPGVYLEDEGIGVRLEDDILVTANGRQNLSAKVPIDADEVEAWMARVRKAHAKSRR
ncbi:MAG: Xaa-Pro peptidase family protein [Planctomycetota bacterium]